MSGRRYKSRFPIVLSLEEKLEVDKVYARSQDDENTGLFDNLYQGVQTEIDLEKAKEEKELEDESTSDNSEGSTDESIPIDESSDSNPEDDSSPPEEPQSDTMEESKDNTDEETKDDKSDNEKDPEKNSDQKDETKEALESLLQDHNEVVKTYISLESNYYENSLYSEKPSSLLASGFKKTAYAGFKYGPILLKHIYKGVLMALSITFKAIVKSTLFITGMIKKHMNSYQHHKNSIYELRKTIELIETNDVDLSESDEQYSKEAIINKLKAGTSVDVLKLCETVVTFNTAFFKEFQNKAFSSLNDTQKLIQTAMNKNVQSPHIFMQDNFNMPHFSPRETQGYDSESPQIVTYVYQPILPGDFLFMGRLPRNNLKEREDIFQGYKEAELFIGLNQENTVRVERIDYMELDDIKRYLDHLESLCSVGMSQEKILHGIITKKNSLKLQIASYLKYLSIAQSKVSIEDSLAEYISLKIRYFDNTLVHGCDAVHEYTTSYIAASLTYIAACLKRYS